MKTVADPAVLEALTVRLTSLRPESRRRWGTLTAHEMLCHLGDATEMVLGTRPRERPIRFRHRRIMKAVGLWSPIRWPHGWKANPAHIARLGGTKPTVFEADLRRVLEGLRGIAAADRELREPMHGTFGAMSVRDWQRWAYKHTDHHLRQFGL